MRVLFICGKNLLRSPTAEQVFSAWPGIEVVSSGINQDADNPATTELLEWADLIFVMEKSHRSKLSRKFGSRLRKAGVVCLEIPDDFEFMEPSLVSLLNERVPKYLPVRK